MPIFRRPMLALAAIALAVLFAGAMLFHDTEKAVPLDAGVRSTEEQTVTVYVSGAVMKPGVVSMRRTERVEQALAACGGVLPQADLANVNLAQPLKDGMQIRVPERADAGGSAAHLAEVMADYERREKELSNVEQLAYGDMRVAQEMYARGYEFMPIDLFRAHAEKFLVIDGKIMPSFVAIDGMGPVAAEGVYNAAKDGAFLSRDDFKERTKCPTAVIETMSELGILGDIPESNQISLFDML